MDVVDEDAFFQWKEDITQEYPGKGQALFQVGVRGSYRSLSRGGGGGGIPKFCVDTEGVLN